MIVFCADPLAKIYDTYAQAVATDRLVFGQAYTVPDALGERLLATGKWTQTLPGPIAGAAVEKVPGLRKIDGIGPRRLEALAALGITTLQHLIDAHAVTVDEGMDGSSLAQVLGWQNEAKKLISEI